MRQDGEKIKGVNNDAEVQGIREFDQAVRKAIGDNRINISKSLSVNQSARDGRSGGSTAKAFHTLKRSK